MKKRNRHPKKPHFRVDDKATASTHLRLCHRCFHLNESPRSISKCVKCERQLVEIALQKGVADDQPELFDEADPIREALSDFHGEETLESAEAEIDEDGDTETQAMPPLSGLSVIW